MDEIITFFKNWPSFGLFSCLKINLAFPANYLTPNSAISFNESWQPLRKVPGSVSKKMKRKIPSARRLKSTVKAA
jgi:hypothetical protein